MPGRRQNTILFICIAVIAVGLLSFNRILNFARPDANQNGVPCINPALPLPSELHIHPRLTIIAEGSKIPVPTNIGLSFACERAVHTHDTTGEIHIEPNFPQAFTLHDFFSVWDKPFSRTQILGYQAGDEYEVVMTVNGARSEEYGNLVLKDKQEIVIEYKKR